MESYDKSKEDSYILYLDANNLYGHAMCEYLPVKIFQWNNDEWTKEKILSLDDEGSTGYLFSVVHSSEFHLKFLTGRYSHIA